MLYDDRAGIHSSAGRAPGSARVGKVRLAVSNLARSVAFYRDVIGLRVIEDGPVARLGAGSRVLLELEALPGTKAIGRRTRLGLYHTAFLLPSREDLSGFVRHLIGAGVSFGGGDHLYSEALYLTDPDGLTVEVYADRDPSVWTYEGRELLGATNAVRYAELPKVAEDRWQGAPAGTTVGHVHLYVRDLEEAKRFYHVGLGLDIMTWRYPGALFMSAGGYHHRVATNIWAVGSPVANEADARMLWWEWCVPAGEREAVAARLGKTGTEFVDACGIRVRLTTTE